jgi:hypothetical protein
MLLVVVVCALTTSWKDLLVVNSAQGMFAPPGRLETALRTLQLTPELQQEVTGLQTRGMLPQALPC